MTNEHTPSTSVAVVAAPEYRPGMSSIELAPAAWQLAHRVSGTDFVPTAMRNKPEAVLACILAGHEAGISPMQALAKIHVIEGRPAMSAELMRALVLRHGHELWIEEQSSTRVVVGGKRGGGTRETKVTWTLDDAKRAGLDQRQNWKKYPRAMLMARATAELCRAVFPDVLAGISHTIEELTDGDVIDVDYGPPEVVEATTGGKQPPRGRAMKANAAAIAGATIAPSEPDTAPAPAAPILPPLPGEEPDAAPSDPDPVTVDDIVEGEIIDETDAEPPQATPVDETPSMFPPDDEPAVDTGPRSGGQIVAIRFGELGVRDRARRLDYASSVVGRPLASSNELTGDEIRMVLEVLEAELAEPEHERHIVSDDVAAAGMVVDAGADTEGAQASPPPDALPEVASESTAPVSGRGSPSGRRRTAPSDPDGWTGDQWRDFIKTRGTKAAELLKQARTLTTTPITTLDAIAGTGIGQDLVDWLEDKSLS